MNEPTALLHYRKKRQDEFVLNAYRTRVLKVATGLNPGFLFKNDFLCMTVLNSKEIRIEAHPGYAWDGPSGPVLILTKAWMVASLYHDIGYQLMRLGVLGRSCRLAFDLEMKKILLERGMCRFRAWYSYQVVRLLGAKYTRPEMLVA